MWHKAEAIKLLVDACPEAVKVKDVNGVTPLFLGMMNNASPLALEVLRHPSQPRWSLFLKQGPAVDVAEFAAWFGKRRWVAKSKDQHGTTPLQLATKHTAPAAVLELLRAAQAAPLTIQTLGGDTLHLRGWEDAWATPGTNLADALVAGNQAALHGVHSCEFDPVMLNPATMELPPVLLFRPLTAVDVVVFSKEAYVKGPPTTTLSVRLALKGGTVGYARRKIAAMLADQVKGAGGGESLRSLVKEFHSYRPHLHLSLGQLHVRGGSTPAAGRLWLVGGKGGGKQRLKQSMDGKLLQAVGTLLVFRRDFALEDASGFPRLLA
jgi:hypothetical protein